MDRNASKYETIWSAEDGEREEILSETDVDSTHLEHEKQHWQNEEGLHHARRWRSNKPPGIIATIKAWRWVIDTSLLLVITGLLVVLLLRERVHLQAGSGGPQVGSDFTGSEKTCRCSWTQNIREGLRLIWGAVSVSTKTVKWNADYSFVPTNTSEFFTDAMVDKWNTMMPSKRQPLRVESSHELLLTKYRRRITARRAARHRVLHDLHDTPASLPCKPPLCPLFCPAISLANGNDSS